MEDDCGSCGACSRQNVNDWWGAVPSIYDYVGDYVVYTTEAPELTTLAGALLALADSGYPEFITRVGYVGEESLVGSLDTVSAEDFTRWILRHNDFDKAEEVHAMILEGVTSLMIKVDVPLTDEEVSAMMREGCNF